MARTNRRDEIEQAKHKAKKVTRTLVRLNMSLLADDLLNELIPEIDEAVDQALAEGRSWEFDVADLVSRLGDRMRTHALAESRG